MVLEEILSEIPVASIALALGISIVGYVLGGIAKDFILKATEAIGLRQKMRYGLEKEAKKLGFDIDVLYLFALVVKYSIYLVTAFLALDVFNLRAATLFLSVLVPYLPKLIGAIVIVLIGAAIVEFLADVTKFMLRDYLDDTAKEAGFSASLSTEFASLMRYFLYTLIFMTAILQLGFKAESLMNLVLFLCVIFVSTIAVVFVFSMKDHVPNLTAGAYLKNSKNVEVGDRIRIGGVSGDVERIGPINTVIKSGKSRCYIPNSKFLKDSFVIMKK